MQKNLLVIIFISMLCIQTSLFAQGADIYLYEIQWDKPVTTTSPTSLSMSIEDYSYPDPVSTLDFKLFVDSSLVQTDSNVVLADLPSDEFGYGTTYVTEYEFSDEKDSVEIWIEISNPNGGELEFSTYSQTITNSFQRQFVYLPLPGGTYSIDSTNGDFANPTLASFVMNQRGVSGDVVFNISPGVYEDTPIGIMGDIGSKITFRKDPAQTGDVIIEYQVGKEFEETTIGKGTKTQNGETTFYPQGVVTLNQANDVHFENINFVATETTSPYNAEVAVYMDGSENISFDNCGFEAPLADTLKSFGAPFYEDSKCV